MKKIQIILLLTIAISIFAASNKASAATSTEPNFKVAFIGDSNRGSANRAVLNLIKNEGADLVLHQGDFAYSYDSAGVHEWMNNVNNTLGGSFPYLGSVGNHDDQRWGDMRQSCSSPTNSVFETYSQFFRCRLLKMGSSPTVASFSSQETDDNGSPIYPTYSSEYKGIKMVFIGENDKFDSGGEWSNFINQQLNTDHIWKICSWHKNQKAMQHGTKGDSMGWGVYDACRQNGAIIATGHEHTYSRTKTMTSFQNLAVDTTQHPQDSNGVPGNKNSVIVGPDKSFAFVAGTGGASIRNQDRCLPSTYPYGGGSECKYIWANIYTSDQGGTHGALFITFNVNGDPTKARGYFKNVNGEIIDEFDITSENAGGSPVSTPTTNPIPTSPATSTPLPLPTAIPTGGVNCQPATPRSDADGDSVAGEADFIIWKANYRTNTDQCASKGDFNGDGFVDGIDYSIWLNDIKGTP